MQSALSTGFMTHFKVFKGLFAFFAAQITFFAFEESILIYPYPF